MVEGVLSIVLPAYNEAENLPPLLKEIGQVARSFNQRVEAVVVDDGSNDGTWETLGAISEDVVGDVESIVIVRLKGRRGQTIATAVGMSLARGELVAVMDSDGQNDPADLPLLLDQLESDVDLVTGWRKNRQDGKVTRILPSLIANRLIGWTTGVTVRDLGCSLRVYRRWLVERLLHHGFHHRYLPIYCTALGARMAQVPVSHRPRRRGQSKYGLKRIFEVLKDLPLLIVLARDQGEFGRWGFGLTMVCGMIPLCLSALTFMSGWKGVGTVLTVVSLAAVSGVVRVRSRLQQWSAGVRQDRWQDEIADIKRFSRVKTG